MPEPSPAHCAREGILRLGIWVVDPVGVGKEALAGVESEITLLALVLFKILFFLLFPSMHSTHVSLEPAGLAKGLSTLVASDRPSNAVLPKVVPQGIPVSIHFKTHVALEWFPLVAPLVDTEG